MTISLTQLLDDDRPWAAVAACRDADDGLFFPGNEAAAQIAVRICAGCPAREDCLEWALEMRIGFGVWGGLTERERRRLQRRTA